MYLFLLGVLLGAVGVCYLFNKPGNNLSDVTYLSSEIERHEFLACYFRKMLQSANERANLADSASSDGGEKNDSVQYKATGQQDDQLMSELLEKIDRPYNY
jgi:hypothetical protein